MFEDAEDGIEAVRRELERKARFTRRHGAVETLRQAGLDPGQIAPLTRAEADLKRRSDLAAVRVRDGAPTVIVPREQPADSLVKARETGLVSDETDRLFADREGDPLDQEPEAIGSTLRNARLAIVAFGSLYSRMGERPRPECVIGSKRYYSANIEGQVTIRGSLHGSRNGVAFD